MRYFIRFSYCGTDFHGSQMQAEGVPTVQAEMEKALFTLFRIRVPVSFAGRTDTGVHATEMYAHISSPIPLPYSSLADKLNALMSDAVHVSDVFPVPESLHARFSALSRTYKYYITTTADPFRRKGVTVVPRGLDFDAMNRAARLLLGRHDFASFCKTEHDSKTTMCTVMHAKWEVSYPAKPKNQYAHVPKDGECTAVFTIKANRFLRNMVRAVVGTLFDVGRGKITIEQFQEIIDAQQRTAAGASAPAEGLYLVSIEYPPFTLDHVHKRRSPFRHLRRRVRKFFRWRLPRAMRMTRYWIRENIFRLPPLHAHGPAADAPCAATETGYVAPRSAAIDPDS